MDKNIITEITRINQLMKPSLITEVVGGWKSVADDIISIISKNFGKLPDDVTTLITKLKNSVDDKEIVKILAELSEVSDDFYKIIIPKVMSTISDETRNRINQVKNYFSDNIKNKTITINQAKKMSDDVIKEFIETEFEGVRNILKKELKDHIDNAVKQIDEPKPKPDPKVEDLSDEIPDENAIITDSGKISDIFNINTWTDTARFGKLDDNAIQELLNQPLYPKIVEKLENLIRVTDEKIVSIQKLAKALEATDNTQLAAKLEGKLKKELEWLYKKSTNDFVAMRDYFEKIAKRSNKWGSEWNRIKSYSNGGWNFYNLLGIFAKDKSTWERIKGGLTDNIKILFNSERKLGDRIIKIVTGRPISKDEFINSWGNNYLTGSVRGFPTITNKNYEELYKIYGPTGAKSAYWRDVFGACLKYKIYIAFLLTLRNSLSNMVMEGDIEECFDSKDINSEQCRALDNKNWLGSKMVEWALMYKKNPNEDTDIFEKTFSEAFSIENLTLNVMKGDKPYKMLGEIAKFDPGWLGDTIRLPLAFFNIGDNKLRKEELLKRIDEQIKLNNENLKKSEDELEDAIEEVIEDKPTPTPTPEINPETPEED